MSRQLSGPMVAAVTCAPLSGLLDSNGLHGMLNALGSLLSLYSGIVVFSVTVHCTVDRQLHGHCVTARVKGHVLRGGIYQPALLFAGQLSGCHLGDGGRGTKPLCNNVT